MLSDTDILQTLSDFGLVTEGNRAYFHTHLARYRATLELIGQDAPAPSRILELGGDFMGFSLLLKRSFPEAEVLITEYLGGPGERVRSIAHQHSSERLDFPTYSFNIEDDDWPLPDASVDLVLCMEVLEHLAIDPCHAFREANRVLRPGGRLVLTTPNIVSYEALRKMLDLDSPYLFGIYSRNGVYGRHNREFTPWEVSGLGEACGFDTEVLTTRDVYPPSRDTGELIARFGDQLGPDELRHQNIFYRGIKTERAFAPYPDFLYDYDPDQHRARIAVSLDELTLSASDTLRGQARLTNLGGYTWEDQGENYTRLRIVLMSDQGAILDRRFRALILPRPVAPGETLEFTFEVPAPETSGDYRLRFDLVHEKVCWFSELRTRPVDLAVRVTA